MRQIKTVWVIGLLGSLFGQIAVAEGLEESWDGGGDWSYAVSLSVGPAWARHATPQTFYLEPGVVNTYTVDKKKQVLANGEIFWGAEFGFRDATQYQLGLALGALSQTKISGEVWEDANPALNDYTYYYHVRPIRLAVKGKILADLFSNECIKPYVSASVGAAYNKAAGFMLEPKAPEEAAVPGFASKSLTNLSYSLGVGIQAALDENWQVGVGYEFTNWGKYELGRAPGQTLNSGLGMSNFFTNGAMFNLSYVY